MKVYLKIRTPRWTNKSVCYVIKDILIENIFIFLKQVSFKVSENSIKSAQFELISRRNNSNSDLTEELDKGESCLKKLRAKHPKNILFGHLNINSLPNKNTLTGLANCKETTRHHAHLSYVQNQGKLMMQSRENGWKPQFGQFFDNFEVKDLHIANFSEK